MLAYEVSRYFKCKADVGMPVYIIARMQAYAAEACIMNIGSV
jgi:hypothetical protein